MRSSQSLARLFVEDVGVYGLALDERQTTFPMHALKLEEIALETQLIELLLIFFADLKPALAVNAVPNEIGGRNASHRVEAKREHERMDKNSEPMHDRKDTAARLKRR